RHEAHHHHSRFDTWVNRSDPQLDVRSLLHRDAFISFGGPRTGSHGRICHAVRLHRGAHVRLYHLILMPELRRLARQPQ
ncbi:type VI secretion system tip protein VgrG, partial [Pseudomonas syringae pv. tagetis]